MKVAVVGSRGLYIDEPERYLPEDTDEIVSGGATGVDTSAADYARRMGLKLTVFRPDYKKHGKKAPILRNIDIVEYADMVIIFWDGSSRGSKFVIDYCERRGKDYEVHIMATDMP